MTEIKSQVDYDRYINFINSRPTRLKKSKQLYTENHHIIPRSLGGSNDKSNLILLTGREHFIAHLILWKAFGGKMTSAFWYMSNNKRKHSFKITSRQYEDLRKDQAKITGNRMRNRIVSDETRKKMSEARTGTHLTNEAKEKLRIHNLGKKQSKKTIAKRRASIGPYTASEETKQKQSLSLTGRVFSNDHKRNLSKAMKGRSAWNKGVSPSKESIEKMKKTKKENPTIITDKMREQRSKAAKNNQYNKGNHHSIESKRKISEAIKGVPHPKVACPYCGKVGGNSSMHRWHFENCKYKD